MEHGGTRTEIEVILISHQTNTPELQASRNKASVFIFLISSQERCGGHNHPNCSPRRLQSAISPHPSPGLSPDNCQTTISTFSPQIKLEMSSAQGYNHHQPSMSWKVAIFQHIISHSLSGWRLLIPLPS